MIGDSSTAESGRDDESLPRPGPRDEAHATEATAGFQPARGRFAEVLLYVLIVFQSVGVVVAAVLAVGEIETIVGSGPLFSVTGLLIAALALYKGLRIGLYLGLAAPTVSVLCFCVIYGLQWGPGDAQLPISIALVIFALAHGGLSAIAFTEVRAPRSKRTGAFRFQFSIATMLGLMTVIAVSLGLCTIDSVGVSLGVLLSYAAVTGYVLRMSWHSRSAVSIPPIEHLVEAGIYVDDLEAARAFYRGVLGLEVVTEAPGRHVFFRAGKSVLLVFRAETTLQGGTLPPHGATGPGHFALGVPTGSLDAWRRHLQSHGVEIEQEVSWPKGGKSLYFRDPAGNSAELVTRGLWGLAKGW